MGMIYIQGLLLIISLMTFLWILSVYLRNVSIVDLFWGLGFIIVNAFYFFSSEAINIRQIVLFVMVAIWGLRLSIYLAWRNIGKGEDFRYREFRRKFGVKNYWWISYFQTFLLQGILMWIISVTLYGVSLSSNETSLNIIDFIGILIWMVGFIFEAGGDFQMAKFKMNLLNKGKVLNTGFWRFTRHPNYFGDAAVWWGYGLLCIASGSPWYIIGSIIMTLLIIKVSGVALLEQTLKNQKPEYSAYIQKTNSFFPWFPKKSKI